MASTQSVSTSFSRTEPRASALRGYLYIAAATLFWGISATLGRGVFTGKFLPGGQALRPIDPLILSQARTTISFLVLCPWLLFRRGPAGLKLRRADFLKCLFFGVFGIAASNYFYYFAIQKTSVAIAIILQYTAPIWVLLYMVARRLQRPTFARVASVGLAVVGAALAIGIVGAGRFRPSLVGVIAAQLAALAFACYNVIGRDLVIAYDRWRVLIWGLAGAAGFWIVINPPWKIAAAHYGPEQWIFLAVFAVVSVLIPFSFYFSGLHHLDATRAIVTSSLEPVFSIIIAAVFLSETVRPLQIVGIVIVLAATVLVQMPEKKGEPVAVVELME